MEGSERDPINRDWLIRQIVDQQKIIDGQISSAATKAELVAIEMRLDSMVSRPEMETRWKWDDERSVNSARAIENLTRKVESIQANQMPKWMLGVIVGTIPAIIAAVIEAVFRVTFHPGG